MTKLSVNVNKIATLRNARGGNVPNVCRIAQDCEFFGAHGITIHPRPDERHITRQDVYELKEVVTKEYNIEGYPNQRYLGLIEATRPTQATLVPDPPGVLTSNQGWDTVKNAQFLSEICAKIKGLGVRVSLFVDTQLQNIEGAKKVGADRIELYTGPYADNFLLDREKAVQPYVEASQYAMELGLGVNAGHDLSLENISFFRNALPSLHEVSIGHALISESLYLGLEKTINNYLELLK